MAGTFTYGASHLTAALETKCAESKSINIAVDNSACGIQESAGNLECSKEVEATEEGRLGKGSADADSRQVPLESATVVAEATRMHKSIYFFV